MKHGKRGKHISLPKELERNVAKIEALPYVERIIINQHVGARHKFSNGVIRMARIADGGVYLRGYHGNGITDLFVKILPKDIDKLSEALRDYSPNARPK